MKKILCFVAVCAASVLAATVSNPIIWSDVPDVSTVRVGDSYYMVSTTMHLSPGVPVMKSSDLASWRTVGYAYQTLADNDNQNLNNGKNAYGKGSWASSIRFHNGYFYVLTPSYTTGKTHLYKTADVESGTWIEVQLPFYHDPSLFFDDDGSVFVFYGSGEISYVELNGDASGVKVGGRSGKLQGTNVNAVVGTDQFIVRQEGAQIFKVNGEYFLFTISWPSGNCRTEIVYRSKNLLGEYSGRIFLQDNGVAQGGIFDTPEGNWYAMLFRDSGPVGRIPFLVPMKWQDGWPVAENGKAPVTLTLPAEPLPGYGMVTSDDFESETLALEWQWNHNPNSSHWSLTQNPGNLRLTTGRLDSSLYTAKNTLTMRSFGPKCSGRIALNGEGMENGDVAGLVALQDSMGYVGIRKNAGIYSVVMYRGMREVQSVPLSGNSAYLRIDLDLPLGSGTATFYYSENGEDWKPIGEKINLAYTLGMFMGYRFGLFHYATQKAGGHSDFDWFKIGKNEIDEIYLPSLRDIPRAPYGGLPASIPGKIEAENYDVGNAGEAYWDTDHRNEGGAYRQDGVDIVTLDSGFAVGYTLAGEWMEWTVNVLESSVYDLQIVAAAGGESGSVQFFLDGAPLTDTIPILQTAENSWDVYKKFSAGSVELPAGEHILRLWITGAYVNVDWFQFAVAEEPDAIALSPASLQNRAFPKNAKVRVFSLTGKYLGEVHLNGVSASEALRSAGFAPGHYLLR